jgi:hypothetical protein
MAFQANRREVTCTQAAGPPKARQRWPVSTFSKKESWKRAKRAKLDTQESPQVSKKKKKGSSVGALLRAASRELGLYWDGTTDSNKTYIFPHGLLANFPKAASIFQAFRQPHFPPAFF